jgi:CTP:molybdopterin cytidylyltransferase MocA
MPQYRGKGGHPVLIPPGVAKLICDYEGGGGLRQFWLDRPHLCQRLPVDDPGVVFDVDTQADYDFHVR